MKVLFLRFPLESTLGGAEIQTLSLMEGLTARGHAVAFAGSCPVLLAECRKRNIPVVEWHIGPPPVTKLGAITFTWRKVAMRRKLKLLLEQFHDLDVIAMLSLSEKLLLTDCAHEKNIRVVWIEHDRIGRWLTKNPWLPMLLKHSKHATTVAVSELSRKMYEDMGWDKNKIHAIPNGIDPVRIQSEKRKTKNEKITIGCIARLSHEKGIDLLIKAMTSLPPSISPEIVGKGSEEKHLKRLAKKLHLADRITFMHDEKNIVDAYHRFDVLVLPSRDNDPFGMVAAEAMMQSVPVIVTDQCGIAGYLKDGTDAVIVKADSVAALSEGVKDMSNVEYRMSLGVAGQKTANERFTIERMVDEYEKVLRQKP